MINFWMVADTPLMSGLYYQCSFQASTTDIYSDLIYFARVGDVDLCHCCVKQRKSECYLQ